jgi:hypothetical protein
MIKNKFFFKIIFLFIFFNLFSNEPNLQENINSSCDYQNTLNLTPIYNKANAIDTICSKKMYNFLSFIYYQTLEQNLELGLFRASNRNNESPSINIDFNYNPGFIVGIGYHLDNDKIDMQFKYTFMHFTKSTTSSATMGMQKIITPWFDENTISTLRIESCWKFKYDFFDVEFKRESFSTKKLTITPIVSISGGIIKQKYNLTASLTNNIHSNNSNTSYLVGPKVGVDNSYLFAKNFDITISSKIAFLYQDFTTKRNAQRLDLVSLSSNVKEKSIQITPNIFLSLILKYGRYTDDKSKYLSGIASYDFNYLFNQNSFSNLQSISSQNQNSETSRNRADSNLGDLFMHGLNLTFYVSY